MTPDTLLMLETTVSALLIAALPLVAFALHRLYRLLVQVAKIEESPQHLELLDRLAKMAVDYVEEQVHKGLRKMAQGDPTPPPTGEAKKAAAIEAVRSIAPPRAQFTARQIEVAVESAVQQKRASLRPPAVQQ
jgi:hypothetical protein